MVKTYRRLPVKQAGLLMDFMDMNDLDYEIWNVEEYLSGSKDIEIGIDNWDVLERFLLSIGLTTG